MGKLQDPESTTRNRPKKREEHKQYLLNVREQHIHAAGLSMLLWHSVCVNETRTHTEHGGLSADTAGVKFNGPPDFNVTGLKNLLHRSKQFTDLRSFFFWYHFHKKQITINIFQNSDWPIRLRYTREPCNREILVLVGNFFGNKKINTGIYYSVNSIIQCHIA